MNYTNSKKEHSKEISREIGNITNIVSFVPDFFKSNMINKKVIDILEENKDNINKNLWKLNFVELFEMTWLIELNLLSKDIEHYKSYLKHNWWLTVNIDYWNKCSFACSHCSIEWDKNGEDISLNEIQKYFWNFTTFKDTIKEIQFFNGWEILERENFDEIFRYFLKKWIKTFSMISRWINEKDQKKYIQKQKIIKNKFKKLKKDFPDFELTLWISVDNFSKLNFWKLIYNTLFLLDLNSIFNNTHLYFSCTHDIKNKEETNDLINSTVYYIEKYLKLWKSNLLFNLISNTTLQKISKIINFWEFEYAWNDWENNNYYKHTKEDLKLQFDYTEISDNWRWKQQLKKSINSLENKDEILKQQKEKNPNNWKFSCMPFNNPKSVSIQKWWNIKTCTAPHLKYQKNFSYKNIEEFDENSFIDNIARYQANLYQKIWIEEIIKLIKSKRKWNFICMNNMLAKK